MAAFAGLGMSAVGGMVCLLAIAFQCSLPTPWSVPDGQHCIDMVRQGLCIPNVPLADQK
jgi:hypothetical protein